VEVFEQRYTQLTRQLLIELDGATPAQRLERVAELMSDAGYMAEWERRGGGYRLAEHNCAIRAVAERFPEVCAAEARFLRRVLGAAVERVQHIPTGCNACEYSITFAKHNGERR
jgi:predicted ArsR family transcriptional regulator